MLTNGRVIAIAYDDGTLFIAKPAETKPIAVRRSEITVEDTEGNPFGFVPIGTEVLFRLDKAQCGHPVIFPAWMQVIRPGNFVENPPMVPFRRAIRDRKLMKRYFAERLQHYVVQKTAAIREFLMACFQANAVRGQLIMVLIGTLFGGLLGKEMSQFITDTISASFAKPEGLGIATVVFTLLVVPPFVLPVRAMDRRTEMTPLWILTFIPSLGLGIILGTMFLLYGAWAIIPGVFFFTCYAVAAAFWYVSQLSRNFQYQVAQQSGVLTRYSTLGDLTYLVKSAGEHGVVDNLLRSLQAFQENALVRSFVQVMVAVDELCVVAGLQGRRSRMKLLEELHKLLRLTEEETPTVPPIHCVICGERKTAVA